MKKLVLAVMALMVFAAPAAAVEVEGDVYAGVYDEYVWRGLKLSGSQPVLQAGMDMSFNGFTVSYWTNTQLSSSSQGLIDTEGDGINDANVLGHDEVTETDIVLDYSFDVNDMLSISVGDIYYNFNVPGNTHELYVGASLNTILAPSLTIYYDYQAAKGAMANGSDAAGMYYVLAGGHDIELAKNLGLSLGAAVSYADESPFLTEDVDNSGNEQPYSELHNYELSVGLSYAVSEQVSIDVSALYTDSLSDEAEFAMGKDAVSTGGVSVTLAF
ncbi:MAG: hypothetical protein C0623_00220 [Desulfuromonas sp.]|nr:MAG: hypothetical protein C0623_00220 [Desulfuromonas sp.]